MALENKEQIYTEKSTLKNWFRSKLKPTQGQFWAWMDSYWHKGEKLPINTIDGLGEAVDGKAPLVHYHEQYATNDATSLSNENVEQWKKKLDVDNLQFDDRAISLTGEYTDFGLNHTSKQSQFNEAMYASNQTKLNEPTSEGTEEEYPFLVGIDDDGYSAKLPAGDLGKNFANTDLQVLENRKHTGSANMEFAMPLVCSNASQKLTNLPNKSKISTASQFVVQDHVTKELGYADNVINALTGTMRLASDAEKDAFRVASRKTNETYSTGQPRIDSLLPPLLLGNNTSITLIGLNLFLNTTGTAAKVEIIDSRNNNVVETITNIAVHQTLPSKLTFNINRELYVDEVFYYVRVTHNGLVSIVNTNATFILFKDFNNTQVDYQWRVRTLRSQVEPKTYNLELKNTSDFIFKNTGKNSDGNYESDVINIVSDMALVASKTYIIQAIIKYSISNTANSEKIRFGLIPTSEIPTSDNTVTTLKGLGIMGGGYDLNRWIQIPTPGNGRGASGEYCNLTILIRAGVCLVIFKDVVYPLSVPISMDGTYKLFFNITDTSERYSDIEFMSTSFYQQ